MPAFGPWKNETGFLRRLDLALDGGVSESEDAYLHTHFISSRDRVSTIATTVGTAGTFLLALLAIVVAVSTSVSEEASKAVEAADAAVLLTINCAGDDGSGCPACTAEKVRQAQAKVKRAEDRVGEVERLSRSQVYTAVLLLLAFLTALASQMINPLPPRTATGDSSAQRRDAWSPVRTRYWQKRQLIVVALILDLSAALVLLIAGWSWFS
jgi:hypothetical protein